MSEQPTLTPFTQDEMLDAIADIAGQLRGGGWQPDYLVGIGRGGLVPATYLSHATGTPTLSLDISAHLPAFGSGRIAALAQLSRDGHTLLVVDDINDSGRTIARLRAAFVAAGSAMAQVRFATLIDNIRSVERVDYRSREIDRQLVKDWFVFPWEAVAPTATVVHDAEAVPERLA